MLQILGVNTGNDELEIFSEETIFEWAKERGVDSSKGPEQQLFASASAYVEFLRDDSDDDEGDDEGDEEESD